MDITRTAVHDFWTGHGNAITTEQSIVESGYAPETVLKGVCVRAATANTAVLYVGPVGVTTASGYPLPAGEELEVQIEDPSKIYVVAGTDAGNEVQTITLHADYAVGDKYRLTYDGQTTAEIAADADAAAVQAALIALSNIGPTDVVVGGGPGPDAAFTVTFQGTLAGQDVPLISGVGGHNEKQTIAIDDASSGGTFTLTFDGRTTGAIAYNQDSAAVLAALQVWTSVGNGNVAVTGGSGPTTDWVVEFKNARGGANQAMLVGDGSLLTGGSTTVTITETEAGAAKTIAVVKTTEAGGAAAHSWIAV
jgi:hypothetical protein